MTPDELATLFKRRGDFDDTRKNLLSDFQSSSVGQQFTHQLDDILQSCIEDDPTLLQREKSDFHQLMLERITRSSEYIKVQQFVDSLLQPAQYLSKIENTLLTIVKEQSPAEKENDREVEKDRSSPKKSNNSTSTTIKEEPPNSSRKTSVELAENDSLSALAKEESTKKSPTDASDIDSSLLKSSPPGTSKNDHLKDATHSGSRAKSDRESAISPQYDTASRKEGKGSKGDRAHSTGSSRKVVPKKRNRRQQSVDSNSSLSSPPSSSEPESDGESKLEDGDRAKKVAKKALRDKEMGRDNDRELEPHGHKDQLADAETFSVVKESKEKSGDMDMEVDKDPNAPMAEGSKSSSLHVVQTSRLKLDTQRTQESPSATSPKPLSSTMSPTSHNSSPATASAMSPRSTTSGSGAARRRESEADRKLGSSHNSHTKRPSHQPLPLPPRPTIVPLPPKPTAKPSALTRRPSHSRNSSSTSGGALGNAPGLSPTLPTSVSMPSLVSQSSLSRQNSVSRGRHDSDKAGTHHHLQHPLPLPPHHLQHPLPPPPKAISSGSRSESTSRSSVVHPLVKPSIATSASISSPPNITTSTRMYSHASPETAEPPALKTIDGLGSPKSLLTSTKEPLYGSLKSPGSNSSKGSISSTGSLSTTGSVTDVSTAVSPDLTTSSSMMTSAVNAQDSAISSPKPSGPALIQTLAEDSASEPKTSPLTAPMAETTLPLASSENRTETSMEGSSGASSTTKSEPLSPAPVRSPTSSQALSSEKSTGSNQSKMSESKPVVPSPTSSPASSSSGTSPSILPPSLPVALKSMGSSSSSSSHSGQRLKSTGRTPIPLPHRPIPLPPRPNLTSTSLSSSSSTTAASSSMHSKKKHKY